MAKDGFKHNQHIVPVSYLNGFASIKNMVYSFELKMDQPNNFPVNVNDICFERDGYEFRDENGLYINQNYLENCLESVDSKVGKYRRLLESKAFCVGNYHTKCFLSGDEIRFWIIFAILQLCRSPLVLNGFNDWLPDEIGANLSEVDKRNLALVMCLFADGNVPVLGSTGLLDLINYFKGSSVAVGVAMNACIWTSDIVVYILKDGVPELNLNGMTIVLPVSSKLVMYIVQDKDSRVFRFNRLFALSQDMIILAQKNVSSKAIKRVISAIPFTSDDVRMIKGVRSMPIVQDYLKNHNY